MTPPARIEAPSACSGAESVCATKRYVDNTNGNVSVKGAMVRSVRGAVKSRTLVMIFKVQDMKTHVRS